MVLSFTDPLLPLSLTVLLLYIFSTVLGQDTLRHLTGFLFPKTYTRQKFDGYKYENVVERIRKHYDLEVSEDQERPIKI